MGFNYALVDTGTTIDLLVSSGDFNEDGTVDAADHVVWRKFTTSIGTGTLWTGDANSDGDVDAADRAIWRNMFGVTTSQGGDGGAGIPEPTGLAPILFCINVLARQRRRNSIVRVLSSLPGRQCVAGYIPG
jgi:hypothetical protein